MAPPAAAERKEQPNAIRGDGRIRGRQRCFGRGKASLRVEQFKACSKTAPGYPGLEPGSPPALIARAPELCILVQITGIGAEDRLGELRGRFRQMPPASRAPLHRFPRSAPWRRVGSGRTTR